MPSAQGAGFVCSCLRFKPDTDHCLHLFWMIPLFNLPHYTINLHAPFLNSFLKTVEKHLRVSEAYGLINSKMKSLITDVDKEQFLFLVLKLFKNLLGKWKLNFFLTNILTKIILQKIR